MNEITLRGNSLKERSDLTVVLRRRAKLPRPLVEGPDPMSSDVFADQYGAAAEDIETVRTVFESAGLAVSKVRPYSRRLTVSGTTAALGAVFGTRLVQVRSQDLAGSEVETRSHVIGLPIPDALSDIVVAVLGESDLALPRPGVEFAARLGVKPPMGRKVGTAACTSGTSPDRSPRSANTATPSSTCTDRVG